MAALVYYLLLPFIYLISILPFPVLYLFSDFLYVLIYYVTGYRKKVVLENLRNSFPEKSEQEINRICKDFFHYLCDLVLETIKMLTISEDGIMKHCSFDPASFDIFERYAAKNQSVIIVMGHWGNWEWAGHPCSIKFQHRMQILYHPLANKYFNGLMYKIRSRTGVRLIAMKDTYKDMLAHRTDLTATAFVADQTPQPKGAYWTTFLNQDTPVFKGTEVIAKKMDLPVVYAAVKRIKRGYYRLYAEVLTEHSAQTTDGEISELHTKRLEQDIREQPAVWLWSHRRWKHKRPVA